MIEFLKKLFKRKRNNLEIIAIRSDLNRFESPSIDSASMQIDSASINQSLNQSINHESLRDKMENNRIISSSTNKEHTKKSILLQEDSLKLGVAAGFVGRSLMDIEDHLSRISSQTVTKEWMSINLIPQIKNIVDDLSHIKQMLKSHEENEEQRFETVISAINNLSSLAKTLPPSYQHSILTEIKKIKESQLTPKMKELISIVKTYGEISYEELSRKLHITQDALRGLLSRTIKLTNEIERFQKEGKGWVRYVKSRQKELGDNSDSERFKSDESSESLRDKMKNSDNFYDFSDLP